jgi:hypothetical protein
LRTGLMTLAIVCGLGRHGDGAAGKAAVFWQWFESHEAALFAFEQDQERVFQELNRALGAFHADLTFEFSPVVKGRREFVISAAGLKSAFPAVEALHAAAPKLPRWIFIKFRPPRTPINDLEYGGKHVRARDVHYLLFADQNPKVLGVMVFLEGYDPAEKQSLWGQIGFLLLDEALGEYTMETKVGSVVFQSRDSKYFAQARPLAELPADFAETYRKRVRGKSAGRAAAAR